MADNTAKVTVTGTAKNPQFNFDIPSGAKGERGTQGPIGPTPKLKVGEVNTLPNPSDAEWISGMIRRSPEVTAALSETFPATMKGEKGEKGDGGMNVGVAVADLNNYLADGYYKMEAGAVDLKNLPPNLTQKYGTLAVLTTNGTSRLEQVFYPTASSQGGKVFFIRSLAGSLWSPWRTVATQRVDNTAGRAIYTWDDTTNAEQLIYGDTGWRVIAPDEIFMQSLANPQMVFEGGRTQVRRIGRDVFLKMTYRKTVSESLSPPNGLPTGWKPSCENSFFSASANLTLGRIWLSSGGTLSYQGILTSGGQELTITMIYPTNDPWPTTLPGSAIGTIPN